MSRPSDFFILQVHVFLVSPGLEISFTDHNTNFHQRASPHTGFQSSTMETDTPPGLLNAGPTNDVQDDRIHSDTGEPGTTSPDKEKGSITEMRWREWYPSRLWVEYVCPEMPLGASRDHHCTQMPPLSASPFAQCLPNVEVTANEQTFIAWFGVAESMSVLGVAVAQIARLEALLDGELGTGGLHRVLSVSLGCVCQALAAVILLIGAYRFFETQHGLVNPERLRFSPWGIYLVAILILLVSYQDRTSFVSAHNVCTASGLAFRITSCF